MKRILVKKRKKKKRLRKILLVVIILLLSLTGFGVYQAYQTLQAAGESYDDLGRDKSDLREGFVSISKDPVSVLLLGVEDYTTGGENGRTDTIMVATFNPNDEKLKLLSIPRDTLVEIVGHGTEEKINHAYARGGRLMTIDTVENLLDIPIDYYATVNFDSFKNIVDILGGVTVDVPFDFKQNSDDRVAEKLEFYEGEMEVDGRHALAYARMRMEDPRGDIGRNERQQQVVKAIIKKSLSLSTITKVDDLAKEFGKNVTTNLGVSEGLSFLKEYKDFNVNSIDQLTLETFPERINGVQYQIVDEESLDEIRTTLKNHLEISSIGTVRNTSDYEEGLKPSAP
jgi:LCP family protein required for cell wall assembly